MNDQKDTFTEGVYRGMETLVDLMSRAGEGIRKAGNEAIAYVDTIRLRGMLDAAYAALGRLLYPSFANDTVSETAKLPETAPLLAEIARLETELARREKKTENSEK